MLRVVFVLLLSVGCAAAHAGLPAEAYRVEVQVADQSESERANAAKTTMGDVVARVAGDTQVLQNPIIHDAINSAPNYLQQFSYTTDKDAKATSLKLILNYSPQAIDKLLSQAQVSVSSSGPQVIKLDVSDVQDFASFKQLQNYLKTVVLIRRSELIAVTKDVAQFTITMDGDAAQLTNLLLASNKFQPSNNTDTNANQVHLRWQH